MATTIFHIYRDHLARARNNMNLALDIVRGVTGLPKWHEEVLVDIKNVLDDLISAADKAIKEGK